MKYDGIGKAGDGGYHYQLSMLGRRTITDLIKSLRHHRVPHADIVAAIKHRIEALLANL